MNDSLHDRVIAALGHQYKVEDEIGRGGMSVVYRARDLRLNRPVAIKVLPPELAYDPAIRMRFTREAQTSAQLAHPHIVPIYDVGERDGVAYFVMSHIAGGNLASLLARQPRPPIDETRRLIREIADALHYAHQRGVVHRDVKPDNILIDGDSGRALVTDFGIARAIEAGGRLTMTGIAVGTPAYMSPEQAMGEREVDGRSDIYSLGVLAYQMLTGRVPFTSGNSMALLLKHVNERPQPIAELRPEVPKAVRDAIERALLKDPADRWPTASALRDALTSGEVQGIVWRTENREPVRYTSPKRGSPAADSRAGHASPPVQSPQAQSPAAPRQAGGALVIEPEHLASLTPEQRQDLRLWHGRVNLIDRVKAMRGYFWVTLGMWALGMAGFAFGVDEAPPLVLSPIVPIYMTVKAWQRGKSLRERGVKLRRVLLMPRLKWVIPTPPPPLTEHQLEKLAPREVLDSPEGAAIRRAAADRAAVLDMLAKLSKQDRAFLPDVEPTVKVLVERVVQLAEMLHRLNQSIDWRLIDELDARIGEVQRQSASVEGQRQLALLQRQRATLEDLVKRRTELVRQLDSAGLAIGNLRLDLVKFQSSGLQSALSDVSNATQEARALSRDIDALLDAAAEMKSL
jgi:serine/threonine protein kinase